MATVYRLDYAGAIHHIYVRGNDKRDIFLSDDDRGFFIGRLAKLKREAQFKLYAFCLMTNHFHLLLETAGVPIANVMVRLLTSYAMRFNEMTGSVGHLFQRPYGAKLCLRDSYFIRLVRYIHRNPVQAKICAEPGDWTWSGHRQLARGGDGLLDESLPLSFFGSSDAAARSAYEQFAKDVVDDSVVEFIPEKPRVAPSLALLDVASQVASDRGITTQDLLQGRCRRGLADAKRDLLERAQAQGYSQAEVARLLGCSASALSQLKTAKLNI